MANQPIIDKNLTIILDAEKKTLQAFAQLKAKYNSDDMELEHIEVDIKLDFKEKPSPKQFTDTITT